MIAFILGAGFNANAASEVPPISAPNLYGELHQIDCRYPLVGETLRLCFDLAQLPVGKSIEDLFSESLEHDDYAPLQKLAGCLREADQYIASRLASHENLNCYRRFFDAFPSGNFITFNYDSLPETILFRLRRWYPRDGYGVPVVARGGQQFADKESTSLVLHLHGSLCVRTSETEVRFDGSLDTLVPRERPQFTFDPYSNAANFMPFGRDPVGDDVASQIIAPILNKSHGLNRSFVTETYAKACGLVRTSEMVVAIGYSFNDHDKASYEPLLTALGETASKRLVVVSPDAPVLARKIGGHFPDLLIEAREATFKQWASASFRH